MYDITLSDGTELKKLILNGNNFISEQILPDAIFDGNLKPVIISNGETITTIEEAVLVSNRVDGGKSWFVLREKTPQEKREEAINDTLLNLKRAIGLDGDEPTQLDRVEAQVTYTAMMTDTLMEG